MSTPTRMQCVILHAQVRANVSQACRLTSSWLMLPTPLYSMLCLTPSDCTVSWQSDVLLPPSRSLCFCLCLFVFLIVCLLTRLPQNYTDQIFMKLYGMVGYNLGNNRLNFERPRGQEVRIVFCIQLRSKLRRESQPKLKCILSSSLNISKYDYAVGLTALKIGTG